MNFKKSTLAISSSSSLPAFLSSPHTYYGLTSFHNPNTRWPQTQEHSSVLYRQRCYATLPDGPNKPKSSFHDHSWPVSQHPTPYEIFNQHKTAPYNKIKYYELVKIYHPDRHHHAVNNPLSHAVRTERYRMVVAANQILSDPQKRRAYDLYGAGWAGIRSMENLYRSADRSWREKPGNPSMNATWEDWEEWYKKRDGKKEEQQQPVYMSNQLFAGALCIFIVIGSFGQARRASTNSMNIVEMRDQHHAAISEEMNKRQNQQAFLNRHERVENFLRQRNGWAVAESTSPNGSTDGKGK
ncbi:uncharacterized protein GGS25DRAFT_88479 [Hypoxylon fragiforme]|uniref:uncharacterized protein n=1 Tax=Hypoxylon fragiforme TaxID=63214 RepID=UPI0020C6F462|nr:uncharacterized protein GGS25DRAFT_88479 [Hypoxylon fragiforme]KAI2603316.1 hypothetical protein GGS25DRAFT_88479 [Hypoxylon fragiforme]